MKMESMTKSKWYKVRTNSKKQTFQVLKTAYKTKLEVTKTIKSNNYQAAKFSHLEKMIAEGWTEYETQPVEAKTEIIVPAVEVKETVKTKVAEVVEPQKTLLEETPKLKTNVIPVAQRSQWERLQDFISKFKNEECEITDCIKYGLNLTEVMDQIRPQKDSVAINKSKIIRTKHPRVNRKTKAANTSFLNVFDHNNHVSALN